MWAAGRVREMPRGWCKEVGVGPVGCLPEFPGGARKPAGRGTTRGSSPHGVATHKLRLDLKLNTGIPACLCPSELLPEKGTISTPPTLPHPNLSFPLLRSGLWCLQSGRVMVVPGSFPALSPAPSSPDTSFPFSPPPGAPIPTGLRSGKPRASESLKELKSRRLCSAFLFSP